MRGFNAIFVTTALALAAAISVAPAFATDSDFQQRLQLAEEMVELSQSTQLAKQITDGVLAGQKQAFDVMFKDSKFSDRQREEIIAKVGEVIAEEIESAMKELTMKTAPLLADVYTREELEGILAFYKSAAGKAMLAKQSSLVEKSLAAGQQWNAENLPAAMARMQPRIEAIVNEARKGI